MWEKIRIKKLDRYIMGKFLGTYLFTILLLVVVIIVFDLAEKMKDFIEYHAPVKAIALDYYANFVPFLLNQFSGLITFISVILFTSKMAYQTEIIAILASGVSFKRLLYPYFLSGLIVAAFSLMLNLYIIPESNKNRIEFEILYQRKNKQNLYDPFIYRQVEPGTFVQIRGYSKSSMRADFFVISKYDKGQLVSMLSAERATFNEKTRSWSAPKYMIREFDQSGMETLTKHEKLDTTINLQAEELGRIENHIVTLTSPKLNDFIEEQEAKGSDNLSILKVEKHNRWAYPVSTLILTVIGVSLSSRKVRGGTGFHISVGIALCFSYILFMKMGNEYAKTSSEYVELAVWLPNIIYSFIAYYLYRKAPK